MPARCAVLPVSCPWPLGSCSAVCLSGVLCCACGVLGGVAPVHRCARLVCCVCGVFRHLTPGRRCARSVCCVACAPSSRRNTTHRTSTPLNTSQKAKCPWPPGSCSRVCTLGVLCVRCPWQLGSSSPVCTLGVLCCLCCLIGLLAAVHRCARSVCCVCGVFGHLAPVQQCAPWGVVLCVGWPWPLG